VDQGHPEWDYQVVVELRDPPRRGAVRAVLPVADRGPVLVEEIPRHPVPDVRLVPAGLLDPANGPRLRPLIGALVHVALGCFDDALAYTRAVPAGEGRLRLACALPLLIGLGTLARVRRADDLLDPTVTVKVPRTEVRRHLAWAPLLIASDRVLDRYVCRLRRAVEVPD